MSKSHELILKEAEEKYKEAEANAKHWQEEKSRWDDWIKRYKLLFDNSEERPDPTIIRRKPTKQQIISTAQEFFKQTRRAKEARDMVSYFEKSGFEINKERIRKTLWEQKDLFLRDENGWGLKEVR